MQADFRAVTANSFVGNVWKSEWREPVSCVAMKQCNFFYPFKLRILIWWGVNVPPPSLILLSSSGWRLWWCRISIALCRVVCQGPRPLVWVLGLTWPAEDYGVAGCSVPFGARTAAAVLQWLPTSVWLYSRVHVFPEAVTFVCLPRAVVPFCT